MKCKYNMKLYGIINKERIYPKQTTRNLVMDNLVVKQKLNLDLLGFSME